MPKDLLEGLETKRQPRDLLESKIAKSPSWLPGKERTEKLIAERPKAEEALMKEAMQPWEFKKHPVKSLLRPWLTAAQNAMMLQALK